ncbi:MAG: response regulator transcription factor [Pseudomonadota bacterium]|nr:response regulator transcription factor [Pseudomonadota bacterium]
MKTTVLLLDDQPIYSEGLCRLLESHFEDIDILMASSQQEAIALYNDHPVIDWVFAELFMNGGQCFDLLSFLRTCATPSPLVVLTRNDDVDMLDRALKLGANGYLSKQAAPSDVLHCIQRVMRGYVYLSRDAEVALIEFRRATLVEMERALKKISPRKQEILMLMAEGYSNDEIARSLGVAETTIKSHVSALLRVLGVENRSHCVAEARRLKLV